MTTTRELLCAVAGHTGTETWWRHWANPRVTYTDGVKAFAETAGAYWLLDIFATELWKPVNEHRFLELQCKVGADEKAELTAQADDAGFVWSRKIEWTDCPAGEWKFFFAEGGPENSFVILLPGEY